MKKLTRKYKKWLIIRARREAKKPKRARNRVRVSHLVRAWYGEEVEEVISNQLPTKPPNQISLKENPDETMEYLDSSRNRFRSLRQSEAGKRYNWIAESKSGKGKRRISSYVDFSDISQYGTAPALILTAEYDRLRTLIDDVPPTINLDEWEEPVFRRLYEMGFFEVVGITDSVSERYFTAGDVRTMKIVTGTNSTELAEASESILELCHFLGEEQPMRGDIELALNNALSEAMINVSRHAYPSDHEFRYRHIGKWWVTA